MEGEPSGPSREKLEQMARGEGERDVAEERRLTLVRLIENHETTPGFFIDVLADYLKHLAQTHSLGGHASALEELTNQYLDAKNLGIETKLDPAELEGKILSLAKNWYEKSKLQTNSSTPKINH